MSSLLHRLDERHLARFPPATPSTLSVLPLLQPLPLQPPPMIMRMTTSPERLEEPTISSNASGMVRRNYTVMVGTCELKLDHAFCRKHLGSEWFTPRKNGLNDGPKREISRPWKVKIAFPNESVFVKTDNLGIIIALELIRPV